MKKRLISMAIAVTMLLTAINMAIPIGAFAENEDLTVQDIAQDVEISEESPEANNVSEESEPEKNIEQSNNDSGAELFFDSDISLMATEYTYGSLTYTVSNNTVTITDCDTGVTSVTIPSQIDGMNVTAIGNYAFDGCSNLTSLTIPEGITSLGYYMIRGTAISSITIPSTVTYSGYDYSTYSSNGALAGCTTLNEVIFTQGIEKIPNYICASNSQTSYITKVYIPPTVKEIGNYSFYKCDDMTIYCKDGSYAHQYAIDNNIPFILGNFEYGKPNKPSMATGVIKSVKMTRSSQVYNLLTTKQTFKNKSDEKASIEIEVDWGNASAGKILLSQSGTKYMQSADGNFGTIAPGTYFETGKDIYAIAVDSNGNTLESKKIYLQIIEPVVSGELGGDYKFKIFDGFSFTVPDDKPVLNEQTFNLDLGVISADVEHDGDTFKATIGVNFEKDDDGKFGIAEYKGFKANIKEAQKNIQSGASSATILNKLRKIKGSKLTNVTLKSDWKPEAAVCGYLEGKVENGQFIPTEGGIIVNAALKYTYEGQAFIVVVPVYYSIGAGGEIKVSAGAKFVSAGTSFTPKFTGNFEFAPYFEIGGGIGVVYLGQVGARGKATLSFNIALDHNYQKVDLTGQAYFEIKALSFTAYEKEFASGTWTIYETGRERNINLMSANDDDIYGNIDINAPVTPEDRSYADNPTEWLGEDPQISLMSTDYTNKELRVLQTNAYPDAKPQIMDVDGTKVMLWTADNTSRTASNKSMLVYSVYIDDFDTWSTPKSIMDNGMADFYPVAKDGYVVWQKATKTFADGATLAEVGQNSEVYISKFNGTSFDTPKRLTNNSIIDTQPQIAVDGDKVTVAWTQNTDNNIFGYTGKNAIYQMTYNGSSWSEATVVAENLNTVAHLTVGYIDSMPVIAYSLDEDNNLNTINDREIYLIRNGKTEKFTDNEVIDSNPVIENINSVPALFWYSNNNIYYVTDLDNKVLNTVSADGINQLTDDYSIVSNENSTAILWTTVEDGVSEVHGALYDGSQWSNDITITQTGQSARYPDGMIDKNGKLLIGFNRIQNVVDGDYYKDGQADLCVMNVTPSYDITVNNVFVGDGLAPNTNVPVYFSVTNSGELPITDVSANIIGVDGKQNAHFDFEQTLQPGETADLEGYYSISSNITAGTIKVQVATSTGDEYNLDNNEATVEIGQSDIEITDISDNADGDNHKVTITLKNSGYTTASNVKVEVRNGTENGDVISTQIIGDVSAQTEKSVTFDINANKLATDNSFIALTGMVTSDSAEANEGNNYQGFTIAKGSNSPTTTTPPTIEWKYIINDITVNNEKAIVNITNKAGNAGKLIIAAYSETGQLISVKLKDVALSANSTDNVEIELNTSGAAYVSAYIWDSTRNMQPLSEKKDKNL